MRGGILGLELDHLHCAGIVAAQALGEHHRFFHGAVHMAGGEQRRGGIEVTNIRAAQT